MGGCGELFPLQDEGEAGPQRLRRLNDIYSFAEGRQIDIDRFSMERAESLSLPLPDGRCAIAIDPGKIVSEEDEKEKLLHELGHCERGAFYNQYAACDVRRKHENQADKWAVQHVLSAADLDEAVAGGYTEMWELAEHFGVTEEFMRKAVCWFVHGNLAVDEYMNW